MLTYNLGRLFTAYGITNDVQFLERIGFSAPVSRWIAGKKFRVLTPDKIEKLCYAFRCTPNDLMEWKPDNPEQMEQDIPLKKLVAKEQINVVSAVKGIPFEKLETFVKKIEEIKKSI